jgi:SAM-dependent methyltransferase
MTWQFVPRFGRDADVYSTYRPEYPAQLFEILAEIPLDRRNRPVDLGAGTGKSTRALVGHFAEVIAVEPDSLMVEKLRATEPRALVRLTTAEELSLDPTSVDLVTVAHALHWMDVPRVLANITLWLRPGGILVVWGAEFPDTPGPIRAIVQREFHENWDRFRDARLRDRKFPQRMICAAPDLHIFPEKTIPNVVPRSPELFLSYCSSTSYGSAFARSLPDPRAYWRDLASRSRQAWPDQTFPVDFSPWLILARKQ